MIDSSPEAKSQWVWLILLELSPTVPTFYLLWVVDNLRVYSSSLDSKKIKKFIYEDTREYKLYTLILKYVGNHTLIILIIGRTPFNINNWEKGNIAV